MSGRNFNAIYSVVREHTPCLLKGVGNLALKHTASSRRVVASLLSPELAGEAQLAFIDARTGAASNHAFDKRIEELSEAGEPFAAIAVDIDKFKKVNETVGHSFADVLLQQFVQGIQGRIRGEDEVFANDATLFRTGGDEFVILAPLANTRSETGAELSYEARLEALMGRLNEDYFAGYDFTAPDGKTLRISATSYGMVMRPDDTTDLTMQFNDLSLGILSRKQQSPL